MLRFLAKRRLNLIDVLVISAAGAINITGRFWLGLAVVIVGSVISVAIEGHVERAAIAKALGEGQ